MIPLLALFAGVFAIGFAPILAKWGMGEEGVGPAAAAFWRMALAAPVFWVVYRFREKGRCAPPRPDWTLRVAPGLFFAADLVSWHAAFHHTTTANATLLANLAAAGVPLIGWLWFKERFTVRFALGALTALAGTALLVGSGVALGAGRLRGDFLACLTAVFYSGYLLSAKRLRERFSTVAIMAWSSVAASMALAPAAVLLGERFVPGSVRAWVSLAALAIVCQVLGQGAIVYALAHLPAGFSAVGLVVQSVVVALLGWGLLEETMTPLQLAGGALVMTGVVQARLGSRAEQPGVRRKSPPLGREL